LQILADRSALAADFYVVIVISHTRGEKKVWTNFCECEKPSEGQKNKFFNMNFSTEQNSTKTDV